MRFELGIATDRREEFVDITEEVNRRLAAAGVRDGLCVVYVPHTTAAVTVNEGADPDVAADILRGLRRLAPEDGAYSHAEGNADAHIKATLTGPSQVIPVVGGRLGLGRWQSLYFCEYDGPRSRKVIVHVLQD